MSSSPNPPPAADPQWEALLTQLRQRPPAEPSPFFYARVHARLLAQAESANTLLPKWLRKPAYAAALCALVLAVSGDGAVATPAGASLRPGHPALQTAR